jgi:hypothetical protein
MPRSSARSARPPIVRSARRAAVVTLVCLLAASPASASTFGTGMVTHGAAIGWPERNIVGQTFVVPAGESLLRRVEISVWQAPAGVVLSVAPLLDATHRGAPIWSSAPQPARPGARDSYVIAPDVPVTPGAAYVVYGDYGSGGVGLSPQPYADGTMVRLHEDGELETVSGGGDPYDAVFSVTTGAPPFVPTGTVAPFGLQAAGTLSAPRTATFRNVSPDPVTVTRASIVGADRGDFLVVDDDCADRTIPAGATCDVRVRFGPAEDPARPARTAAVRLATTGASGPSADADLAGTAGGVVVGPVGPAGPQGPVGAPGADGAPGAAGPAGEPGATGPTGATGPQGEPGPPGPDGATGANGADGPAGAPGANGPQGEKGDAGPRGVPGPAGPIGLTGPAGADGLTAVYRCQPAERGGKSAEACFVSFSDGTARPAGARTVRVTVTRGGRVVAEGARTVRSRGTHRVSVRLRRGARLVAGGRYRVRLTVSRRGTKTRTLSRTFVAAGVR